MRLDETASDDADECVVLDATGVADRIERLLQLRARIRPEPPEGLWVSVSDLVDDLHND
jgi:hypothetical protein